MDSRLVAHTLLSLLNFWVAVSQKHCPFLGEFDDQCLCQKELIPMSGGVGKGDEKLLQALRRIKPQVTTHIEIKTMTCGELEVLPAFNPEAVFGHEGGDFWVIQNSPFLKLIPSNSFYGVELQMLYFRNNPRLTSIQPLAFHGLSAKAVVFDNKSRLSISENGLSGIRPNCILTKRRPVIRIFPDYSLRRRFKRSPPHNCRIEFNVSSQGDESSSKQLLSGFARTCPFAKYNHNSALPTTCSTIGQKEERISIVRDPSVPLPPYNYSSSTYSFFSHRSQDPFFIHVISIEFPHQHRNLETNVALGFKFQWKFDSTSCGEDLVPQCYFKIHTSDSWTAGKNCKIGSHHNDTFQLIVKEEGLYTSILRKTPYNYESLDSISPTLLTFIAFPVLCLILLILLLISAAISHIKCPSNTVSSDDMSVQQKSFLFRYSQLLLIQLRFIRGFTFCANRKISPPLSIYSDILGLSIGLVAMSLSPQLMWPYPCQSLPFRVLSIGVFPGDVSITHYF